MKVLPFVWPHYDINRKEFPEILTVWFIHNMQSVKNSFFDFLLHIFLKNNQRYNTVQEKIQYSTIQYEKRYNTVQEKKQLGTRKDVV